jgi:digeranylgeranylglycerophospholipid reductase
MSARGLARAGYSVVLLEEHASIGYPVHCTGLLGLEAFDDLALPRTSIRAVLRRACFHGPQGLRVPVDAEHIAAAVIDRGVFDAALAQEAEQAGAELRLSARVDSLAVDASGVSVTVRHDPAPIRARSAVLACGANYRFARALGLGVPSHLVQSAQVEVPFPAADHVDVYLGRELAPDGFGWVVPFTRDGVSCARLGLMCSSSARDCFARLVGRIWRERGLDGPLPQPRLKALPLAPIRRTYADRVLAVGDAAGIVKPTTGGGIYYSLLSGMLAGQVLAGALRTDVLSAGALAPYEKLWSARLGPDIRAGLTFRRFAGRMDDRGIHSILEFAGAHGIVPLLKHHGNFNWHRNAVIALLRQPGFRRAVLSSIWS